MARKLAIDNTIKLPVKFSLSSAGKLVPFKFDLLCERRSQSEINAFLPANNVDVPDKLKSFVTDVIKGWEGQTLVVEEDGSPAEFDQDALGMLLDTRGMVELVFGLYMKEAGAKEKN